VGIVLLDAMFPDDLLLDPLLPPKLRYNAPGSKKEDMASPERISSYKVLKEAAAYIGKEPAIPVTYLAAGQAPWGDTGVPRYDNVAMDGQKSYVKRFAPGRFIVVDSPHFEEQAIPGQIAQELERLIASLPST